MEKSNKKLIYPDPLSSVTIPITLAFNQTILAKATAFIYQFQSKFYLITNWHNVTGLNPFTKMPLGANAGIPNILHFELQSNKSSVLEWMPFSVDLYNDNCADWLIHPVHKENVDVVAIELEVPENFMGFIRPINTVNFDTFKLEVADDVFILGYPFSLNGGGRFPIWKRGSIATEPEIDYDGLPKIFVDTATRSGMSGSPVIFRRQGIHTANNDGKLTLDTVIGRIQGFVGIYSGRIGKSDLDAQLGIVWKKEVIEEIIIGNYKEERIF